MVRYFCHNCRDEYLSSITKVIDHVWRKHRVEVSRKWEPSFASEDARLPPKKTDKLKVSGFCCEECDVFLESIFQLINHLDGAHGVHIWYERGMTKKRVFFDGILEDKLSEEKEQKDLRIPLAGNVLKDAVPLSKRPYEPRKSDEKDENDF
jgi:hypothetical protein